MSDSTYKLLLITLETLIYKSLYNSSLFIQAQSLNVLDFLEEPVNNQEMTENISEELIRNDKTPRKYKNESTLAKVISKKITEAPEVTENREKKIKAVKGKDRRHIEEDKLQSYGLHSISSDKMPQKRSNPSLPVSPKSSREEATTPKKKPKFPNYNKTIIPRDLLIEQKRTNVQEVKIPQSIFTGPKKINIQEIKIHDDSVKLPFQPSQSPKKIETPNSKERINYNSTKLKNYTCIRKLYKIQSWEKILIKPRFVHLNTFQCFEMDNPIDNDI